MSRHSFHPHGVCSKLVEFDIDDGIVKNVEFTGGCDGNLKAISKLVEGRTVDEVVSVLEGNTCGPRATSCADQFAQALKEAVA